MVAGARCAQPVSSTYRRRFRCSQLSVQAGAEWLEASNDEPVLFAGFYFATPDRFLPKSVTDPTSPIALAAQRGELTIGLQSNRKQGYCVRTQSLRHLATTSQTLSDQAQNAAEWAALAVTQIAAIHD